MGILNIFKRSKSTTSSNDSIGYVMTSKGELIETSGYTRLSDSPEVLTAINQIADLVSNMSIHLMENGDKGDIRIRNNLSRLIDIQPNKFQTRKSFIFWIVKTMMLHGNAVVKPVSRDGTVTELKPLNPQKISFTYDTDSELDYAVKYDNVEYSPETLLHFVLNPSEKLPFLGSSYQTSLRDITHNLKQASVTKRSFMSSNYMPSLIMYIDAETDMTEEERTEFEKKYLHRKDKTAPFLLPEGLINLEQIKPLTLTDLAIHESVKIDKQGVASILGVPPFILGVGTYTKDEWNNFINTKIMSFAQIIQQTLNSLIIDDNKYFNFNPRSLYNYSLTELVSAGVSMIGVNSMRRNELRGWMNLPPDEEMDALLVLENYLQQADLTKQNKLKGGEN